MACGDGGHRGHVENRAYGRATVLATCWGDRGYNVDTLWRVTVEQGANR